MRIVYDPGDFGEAEGITLDGARDLLSYSRDSSERLKGLFAQDQEIAEWAEQSGYQIVGRAHDVHVHSMSLVESRAGLSAAVEAVEQGRVGGIVVHRLDRLGRNFATQDDAIRRIWKAGGRVFSTDYGEWKPDKVGQPQWYRRKHYAEVAEAEYYGLLARLQEGRRQKIARGGYGGGHRFHRRYGVEQVEIQGRQEYRPIPHEQAVIRRICEACPNGKGYHAMARVLNAEGIPTVTGAEWKPKVVRDLALRGPYRVAAIPDLPAARSPLVWTRAVAS